MQEREAPQSVTAPIAGSGSKDGTGAGDHDERFDGFRSYQFSTQQLVRLRALRSEAWDARTGCGRFVRDVIAAPDEGTQASSRRA